APRRVYRCCGPTPCAWIRTPCAWISLSAWSRPSPQRRLRIRSPQEQPGPVWNGPRCGSKAGIGCWWSDPTVPARPPCCGCWPVRSGRRPGRCVCWDARASPCSNRRMRGRRLRARPRRRGARQLRGRSIRRAGTNLPTGAARGSGDDVLRVDCSQHGPTLRCSTNPRTIWASAASTTCSRRWSPHPQRLWSLPTTALFCERCPTGPGSNSGTQPRPADQPASPPEPRHDARLGTGCGIRVGAGAAPRYAVFMSTEGLAAAQQKMADAGVAQTAIDVFTHYYGQLEEGVTGSIPEDTIEPYLDPPHLEDISIDPAHAKEVFDQLVIINLNGGLGTSMGMDKAKSLLPVRDGKTFLDIIVEQVLAARRGTFSRPPLIIMTSFRNRAETLEALEKYPDLRVRDLPLDFLQNKEPKLRADVLTPIQWHEDPDLEWCPPGHGDIYTALQTSGLLQQLLEQ